MGLFACTSLSRKNSFSRESITFTAVPDTAPLVADIYRPKMPVPTAAVLVIHGGGWSHRTGDMSSICADLAKQGFLAFNTTYRLAPTSNYPKAVRDVEGALTYLRENAAKLNINPDRIYVWGYSAGGHLALLLGLQEQRKVRGIVAGGTPVDLTKYPSSPMIQKFIGKSYDQAPALWAEASPINHIGAQSPPIFLYHGEGDKIVDIAHLKWMQGRLKQNGRPVETLSLNWHGHVTTYLFSQYAVDEGIRFLQKLEADGKM